MRSDVWTVLGSEPNAEHVLNVCVCCNSNDYCTKAFELSQRQHILTSALLRVVQKRLFVQKRLSI